METQTQIQLTRAADNALRLLDKLSALEPSALSGPARELVRDAASPLREALRAATLANPEPAQSRA